MNSPPQICPFYHYDDGKIWGVPILLARQCRQSVIQEYFLKKYKFPLVLGCFDGSQIAFWFVIISGRICNISPILCICDSILSKLDSIHLTTANFSSYFSSKICLVSVSCISAVAPDSG